MKKNNLKDCVFRIYFILKGIKKVILCSSINYFKDLNFIFNDIRITLFVRFQANYTKKTQCHGRKNIISCYLNKGNSKI